MQRKLFPKVLDMKRSLAFVARDPRNANKYYELAESCYEQPIYANKQKELQLIENALISR